MKNILKFLTLSAFLAITSCNNDNDDIDDSTIESGENQSTENFENETSGTTEFTDNGQLFYITSNPSDTGDTYRIGSFTDSGWNGTSIDQQFIETLGTDDNSDGTSFIISTADEAQISVESLYFFVSTKGIKNTENSTLTIEGKKDGATVYTIIRNSDFSNVETFNPNNGYTFIDFSTEGGADNSNTEVDEIVFTTTNDGDYVALDAFTWNAIPISSTIEN
jgi:hypothetical protein